MSTDMNRIKSTRTSIELDMKKHNFSGLYKADRSIKSLFICSGAALWIYLEGIMNFERLKGSC